MTTISGPLKAAALATQLLWVALHVQAQSGAADPNKSTRMVVPQAMGGTTDRVEQSAGV